MNKLFCLNKNYSTTRLCYKLIDDKYLDKNGKIKEEYKFKLNFLKLGIVDSKIPAKEGEKFDTYMFLPEGEGRKGEGGLRTKGYFKFSYENLIMNDKCLIMNDENGNEFVADKETLAYINSTLKKLPLISIITVVYNGEKYLEETIQSVINQTYPNVEYIIIDGGSTDGTLDIIKKYEKYIDYWVSEKDHGIYDAIHKGFLAAGGEILAWLNADDIYYSWTLKTVVKIFVNNNIQWLTGVPSHINEKSEMINIKHPTYYFQYFIKNGYYNGKYFGFIQQEGTFFSKKLYMQHPLKTDLKLAGDYKLWIDFAKSEKLFTVKTILASFRVHGNQKSSDIDKYYHECEKVNKNIKIKFLKYIFKPLGILMNYKLINL